MTLEKVIKHFENALEVMDHSGDTGIVDLKKIRLSKDGLDSFIQNPFKKNWLVLWHRKKGFAKILTTKDYSFSITKEQLRQLTDPKVKEWFPEVFEVKQNGWYKDSLYEKWMAYFEDDCLMYGFDTEGDYFNKKNPIKDTKKSNDRKATEQEVFEALKDEAVKRGFVEGAFVKTARGTIKQILGDYHFDGELATFSGDDGYMSSIFLNGKWATIIQTITKSEAEKLLNKKIID